MKNNKWSDIPKNDGRAPDTVDSGLYVFLFHAQKQYAVLRIFVPETGGSSAGPMPWFLLIRGKTVCTPGSAG